MASAAERRRRHHLSCFLHSANLTSKPPTPSSKINLPLLLPEFSLSFPLSLESTRFQSPSSAQSGTPQPTSSASSTKNTHAPESGSGFPSTVRISTGKGRGPAFVGQVFSMCDLSGTGLMSVSTNIDIPFLSKRTPEWLKKIYAAVTKSERKNGPVFRSFMDLGDAALDQAIFPENTPGFVLDAFARSALWKIGLDYRHGTGHGVGAALNVHEGPQSISFRFGNMTPLLKGMVVSNEPGYYEDHSFGIRIENLLFVKEVDTPNRFGGIGYMGFEKLTFVPIQTKMVDLSLLSTAEIDWLNDYHHQTWEKVSPLVSGSARQWLWNNTRPVGKPLYILDA